ncbi:head-tail adaptor protein [Metasolibacillus meyeri]|uniref:phage head completion protein n=1 Tax=Metasolibacillus meyeri TaxID=1071052 RepID=UPI000D2FB6EE|nr:head-tail adaptor protein [Metasolibacillus meyeri]
MFFSPFDEFPHIVEVKQEKTVPNGTGGTKKEWVTIEEIACFVDTPKTSVIVEYSKLNIKLSRFLYCPYGTVIPANARLEFDGKQYKIAGDSEDQGGMHEVDRYPMERI